MGPNQRRVWPRTGQLKRRSNRVCCVHFVIGVLQVIIVIGLRYTIADHPGYPGLMAFYAVYFLAYFLLGRYQLVSVPRFLGALRLRTNSPAR